jgi:hypothetical protein
MCHSLLLLDLLWLLGLPLLPLFVEELLVVLTFYFVSLQLLGTAFSRDFLAGHILLLGAVNGAGAAPTGRHAQGTLCGCLNALKLSLLANNANRRQSARGSRTLSV